MSADAVVDTAPPPDTASLSAREAAIALARSGVPITRRELMTILQIKKSAFFRHAALGHYDALQLKPPTRDGAGAAIYSGTLVSRWLDGEAIYTFGRKVGKR